MDCNSLLSSMSGNFYYATFSATPCVRIATNFSQMIDFWLGLTTYLPGIYCPNNFEGLSERGVGGGIFIQWVAVRTARDMGKGRQTWELESYTVRLGRVMVGKRWAGISGKMGNHIRVYWRLLVRLSPLVVGAGHLVWIVPWGLLLCWPVGGDWSGPLLLQSVNRTSLRGDG